MNRSAGPDPVPAAGRSGQFERFLDRYLGISVLFCLGVLRRRRGLPATVQRIGVIQPTAIGDMFLISGLLLHLRQCYPAAEIHIFHGPSNAAALPLLPIDSIGHRCIFKRPWQSLAELRSARLDVIINCAPWTRITAILAALSGARVSIRYRSPGQFADLACDIAVPYRYDRHEIENHRELAGHFGPLAEYRPVLRRPKRGPAMPLPYERLVIMHVAAGGSRARQKSWPFQNWVELTRRLAAKGLVIGFSGTKADQKLIDGIIAAAALPATACVSLAGQIDLEALSHVLIHARLLVTIDTGVAHLAAGLDAMVVALHGPTRFARWGACNPRSVGIDADHPAHGYINLGFEEHPLGDEIMRQIPVDIVFETISRKLDLVPTDRAGDRSTMDADEASTPS